MEHQLQLAKKQVYKELLFFIITRELLLAQNNLNIFDNLCNDYASNFCYQSTTCLSLNEVHTSKSREVN